MCDEIKSLKTIVERLHELNFKAGVILPYGGGKSYDFERFLRNNGHQYAGADRACAECDLPTNPRAPYVSHGSHTVDFVAAHLCDHDAQDPFGANERACYRYISKWFGDGNVVTRPVLFLLENPAGNDGNGYCEQEGQNRLPSADWYWLDRGYDDKIAEYGLQFIKPGEYGKMIFAVINTFHLANAYATNTVKCGVCGDGGHFLTTRDYPKGTIEVCQEKWLKRELAALCQNDKNLLVLAFGNNAYINFKKILEKESETENGKNQKILKVRDGNLCCDVGDKEISITLVKFRHPSHAHAYCKEQIYNTVKFILNKDLTDIPYNNEYLNGYSWCIEYDYDRSTRTIERAVVLRRSVDAAYKSQYLRYSLNSGECDYWRGTRANNADRKVFDGVGLNDIDSNKFKTLDGQMAEQFRQLVSAIKDKFWFCKEF